MSKSTTELAMVFGGHALGINLNRRKSNSLVLLASSVEASARQFTGSFLPPYASSLATGQLNTSQTLLNRTGWVDELVFQGGRLDRVGGTMGAMLGMMHSNPTGEIDLPKWVAAGEPLGCPIRSAVPMCKTHNTIRKRRINAPKPDRASAQLAKAGDKSRTVCESINHAGKLQLGDTTLRHFKSHEPGYPTWIVCRQLYGDVRWCTLCRRFAVRRGSIKKRDKRTRRLVTIPFPNSISLESLAARTFGSSKDLRSPLSKSLVALKERCTIMVCVGALLSEPMPAAKGEWRGLHAMLTVLGSAARCGAIGAFLNVLLQRNPGGGRGSAATTITRRLWITATFMDSGTLAASHAWAHINNMNKDLPAHCLPRMLQEQAIAVAYATIGRAELTMGAPTCADRTFFALSDEALRSYSATPMPKSVQYIFYKVPGTMPGSKCLLCSRAWFDVLNAFRQGWKVRLVLTGPLAPEKIVPKLPTNTVHALVEVLPIDGLERKRMDPALCKPARYPTPPDIIAGEFVTWGTLATHLALRKVLHGSKVPPSMYEPLVIYMSLTRALGGVSHTYHLLNSKHITLTYGACARDLVKLQRDRQPASITVEHGIYADFTNYRAGGRHARLVREAYARDVAWLGNTADSPPEALSTTMLWDAM